MEQLRNRKNLPHMAVLFATAFDCFTTTIGLTRSNIIEFNPLAALLISLHPVMLYVFNLITIGIVFIIAKHYTDDKLLILGVFGSIKLLVGLHNLYILLV